MHLARVFGRDLPFSRVRATHISLFLACLVLSGCGSVPRAQAHADDPRRFDFQKDTFSFSNDLVWEYYYDSRGKWVSRRRHPQPDYTHHCFVVARTTRQFFLNARFEPSLPMAGESTYRRLIRQVASSNPRKALPEEKKILIPGYPDLRTFSKACEELLKQECGGAWQSYFQRGHWRMTFPVSHRHQEHMAAQLVEDLKPGAPLVVHVFCFPVLKINHALVLFGAIQDENQIRFQVYDPYNPDQSTELTYDRHKKEFTFPANDYFQGGRVKVYEVYYKWDY